MRNLRRVLLERCIAVRIAIRIKCESHFVVRQFSPQSWRRRGRCSCELFCRLSRLAKFLPKQRGRRQLAGGISLLQRFESTFSLPQRKRHVHSRRDENRLNTQKHSKPK